MITEHLMRPGSGSVAFTGSLPTSVSEAIRKLVDENHGADAVGASIVITPTHLDAETLSDAEIRGQALYVGPVTGRPTRTSLECAGLSRWLDTYLDSTVTRSAGTPTQWLGDLLANGLSAGTVTGGSNVSRTFPAHSVVRREALDAWARLAGVEYRVNPDFTVDTAAASTLFVSPPAVIVTRKAEGLAELRGVDGSMLDQALTQLGPSIATKAVALATGSGAAIAKGTATRSVNLKTPTGGAPALVTVLSAPSEASANANTVASNFLNLQGMRRQINVSSNTHILSRYVRPGDEVYVFDIAAGLYDTDNPVQFRGATVFPALVRLLSYSWPIERGMGVYVRPNAASPAYVDVTDWVAWEDGDTWWTVGDWSPPSYGPTNRSHPEIEERVAAGQWTTFVPSWTNLTLGTGHVNSGMYCYTQGGVWVFVRAVLGTGGAPTGSVSVTLPNSITSNSTPNILTVGTCQLIDAGVEHVGVGRVSSGGSVIDLYADPNNVNATTPFTWASGDQIIVTMFVPL